MLQWLHPRGPEPVGEVSPEAVARALAGPEPPLLLDVRTPAEHAAGHIHDAKLIPLSQLASRAAELPHDRPIVCVCRSGQRSALAVRHLCALGFSAQNMAGGMLRWRGPVARKRGQMP